jgi:ABC-type methionine transport system ATPase subunit
MIVEQKVRLIYPKHLLDQPLIYRPIRQFDLLTNILEARVTAEEGWLVLAMRGERERVEQGLSWMTEQGVQVEIMADPSLTLRTRIEEGA